MWASGCVVAELILGVPLLDGKDEVDQMEKIVQCIGGEPSSSMSKGPRIRVSTEKTRSGMELTDRLMDHVSEKGLRLLHSLLTYEPALRFTAKNALASEFFLVKPLPATDMPTYFG